MALAVTSPSQRQQEISSTLVAERLKAGVLRGFPGDLPDSLDEAYAVQAISRAKWPDTIIGWKVGGIPPRHRAPLGADYLSGPIFARRLVRAEQGRCARMPVFADGFAAVEAEFVMELGATRECDRVYIGAEIASSPIVAINDVGPLAVVCDFGNNNGLLVGPEITGWRSRTATRFTVATYIEDELIGEKVVLDLPAAVSRARDFLFALARRQNILLSPGTFVSTGAITGVHDAHCGNRATLDFGPWGSLDLELVAEQPFE